MKPCIEVDNTSGCMSVGKKYRGSLEKALEQYVKDRLEGRTDIVYRPGVYHPFGHFRGTDRLSAFPGGEIRPV